MTTIGLIGAGLIGGTVARLAVAGGYDVVLSNSRGPETLEELVDDLGPRARAALPAEAADAGDLVVVTIPLKAYRSVPVEPLAGKAVIDTNNYYPQRDGQIPELDDASTTSSELLQNHLPTAGVVKAFNNILFTHLLALARPAGSPERSALAIAGDDVQAKATVTAFLGRTDTPDGLACVLALLIDVLVARGVLGDADQVLDEAGLPAATPTSWAAVLLTESIGRLRCAQGRIAEGASLLQDVEACWAALQVRHPNATGWRADLAVALAQLGEVGEAVRIADEQLGLARRCGSVRALGVALRTSGMVAKTDGIEALRAAVEVLDPSPFRLEAACALVELGAALRRANQARAARVPLRRGADLAGRCGAAALAARANEELRAAGARPRRARVLGVEALTAREHQVARLAAAGLTNREIAQQLFVTERTIESHLLAAFGKLGVNRRGALTPELLDAPSP